MGRRAKPESQRRALWLNIRVTKAERAALHRAAADRAVPLSRLVREGLELVLANTPASTAQYMGER